MDVKRRAAELIVSIPTSSRWKVDEEIDFEHRKDVQGGTVHKHLGRIAAQMINWECMICDSLGLTEVEKQDILTRNSQKPELQR